jgi:hypothetical protein
MSAMVRRGLFGLLGALPFAAQAVPASAKRLHTVALRLDASALNAMQHDLAGSMTELRSFEPDLEPFRRLVSEQLRQFVGQTIVSPTAPTCPPAGWDTLENVR